MRILFFLLSLTVLLGGYRGEAALFGKGKSFSSSSGNRSSRSKLTSVTILDRNGLSETISSEERLSSLEKIDFLSPQPYQKVMRLFEREKNGDVRLCLTSYHPNGQLKQYLEGVNNRAYGMYREWFPNGNLKVDAYVIGGIADLNAHAEESWLFDGISQAWDEEGNGIAQISYQKGELEGDSYYFHPNGMLWKIVPFSRGNIHGTQKFFLENGLLFQTTTFCEGIKNGHSYRYWDQERLAYHEWYVEGRLQEADFFSSTGECLCSIREGKGFRAIFGKAHLQELQEYKEGYPEGEVKTFDAQGRLLTVHHLHEGEKEGEQWFYFPLSQKPKMLLSWRRGILHGAVKTWYENGTLQSQRELAENKKNGLLTAWYPSGNIMLVEEYEEDRLVKGEYFRKGEKVPCSRVERGKGIATLFDESGNLLRKVSYQEGNPIP